MWASPFASGRVKAPVSRSFRYVEDQPNQVFPFFPGRFALTAVISHPTTPIPIPEEVEKREMSTRATSEQRPHVLLNVALTSDGRMSQPDCRTISCPAD